MGLNTILGRSASTITPFATRLLTGQSRNFTHQSGRSAALFTAVNHLISRDKFLLQPCVSRYSYSASPAVKRPSSDESLIRIIESEIKCSEDSFEEVEDIPEGFPFKLSDNPGKQTVSLTREYQGETIHVEVEQSSLVTGQEDDEDDGADDDTEKDNQVSLPMIVKVSKAGGPCLEFGVTAYADEIVIDSLSVKDPDMAEDQLPYEGPRFDELDENFQKAFHKYLEIRGIKPGVTNFMHGYMVNKEHREYTNWLKNLKKFVEA